MTNTDVHHGIYKPEELPCTILSSYTTAPDANRARRAVWIVHPTYSDGTPSGRIVRITTDSDSYPRRLTAEVWSPQAGWLALADNIPAADSFGGGVESARRFSIDQTLRIIEPILDAAH